MTATNKRVYIAGPYSFMAPGLLSTRSQKIEHIKRAAEIAIDLADGTAMNEVEGVESWSGGPNGTEMQAIFLKPVAITKDNLDTIIDAGWVSKDVVCQGVDAGSVPACD